MSLLQGISEVLKSFDSIGLCELEAYMLMDRIDTKYLFPADRIPAILKGISSSYRSLEISSLRVFPYHTTYFDSIDWFFFRQHITERGYRSKVRFRKYEQTGVSFLEVKNRTNKMRTEKWRIMKEMGAGDLDEESQRFISCYIPGKPPLLGPVLVNRFNRITLASRTEEERVTIDFDLTFSDQAGNLFSLPCIGIAEKKRPDFTNRSQISEILKKNRIYPTGFSKYCLGASVLHEVPGKNHLKPKRLQLNRIQNECI